VLRAAILAGLVIVTGAARAAAQTTTAPQTTPAAPDAQDPSLRNDNNPTRAVFFSLRPEFYAPTGELKQGALVLRYDQAALIKRRWLPGKRGVVLRFELPVSGAQVSGATNVGLGDAYAQMLLIPYSTRRFSLFAGSGLIVPTATSPTLGLGKLVVAPAAGPIWFFAHGLVFVKVQYLDSIAGDSSRPEVRRLLVTPVVIHTVGTRWWILADSETNTNHLRDDRTDLKSGVQIGHVLSRTFGVWVKPEWWWGPNTNDGWNLKFGMVWYR
jgi:hypothetical protein